MTHPRVAFFDQLCKPQQTAAALGYRAPAQWEAHATVWVCPPHNEESWPRCLDEARAQFDAFIKKLSRVVPVSSTDELAIATNDSWLRDFGPIFVVQDVNKRIGHSESPPLACHDFHFNGWGNKYELRDSDDKVPQHIAHCLGLPIWVHDFVLEGGAVDVNGRGSVLTTEQCLLNPNRNPTHNRAQIEQYLRDNLGLHNVIWMAGGIVGDDTDGHVDDVARFINSDTVTAVRAPADHPDHVMLERNWSLLTTACAQDGGKLNLVELPAPEPIYYDYPADRFDDGGRAPLPASYANFLISNQTVWVPVFGQKSDEHALKVIQQSMPGYAIEPIRAEWLIVGQGGLHCLCMGQPACSGK